MKKSLALIFGFFFTLQFSAQKVFSVDYQSQADVKVFVVKYESQADLNVYKVDYQSQAEGNEGKWFFVKYRSQAGWKKKEKKQLMY